jgi:hypothetical protein
MAFMTLILMKTQKFKMKHSVAGFGVHGADHLAECARIEVWGVRIGIGKAGACRSDRKSFWLDFRVYATRLEVMSPEQRENSWTNWFAHNLIQFALRSNISFCLPLYAANELVHGRDLRRNDGFLLAMLDLPTGNVAFEGFIHGRFVGREEERNRTRQFFHDILSSKILVASFIAHEIYQRLAANGAEEAEELGRVTKLLRETIHDIFHGFEELAIQAEIIPEHGADSLKRLLERQENQE